MAATAKGEGSMSNWYSDRRWSLPGCGRTTIDVIERPKDDAQKREGQSVPFGFAREIPRPDVEPQLWEGD